MIDLQSTKVFEQMESQLQHTHGRHYDDQDPLTTGHHTGREHNEEHHGEKKSVIKKVKEKAKKLKNTITKHGHGHDQHHPDDDEDEDDEEAVEEDAEVHGAPKVNPEKWRGKIGQPTGMDEDPFAPNPTRVASPISVNDPPYVGNRRSGQTVNQEGLKDRIEKSTGMVEDPHAPKDPSRLGSVPSNYETKVTDPTHRGGKEADVSQIRHSFGKMGIDDEHGSGIGFEPKTLDHNRPENLPRDTVSGNPSSGSSSYADKISSSASGIADKAAVAKDVIASKLGYSSETPISGQHGTGKIAGGATDYAHKMPVYEKVVDAGSAVMSKVQESVSGTGQVQRGSDMSSGTWTEEKGREAVSVTEYLVETLKPGDEDKALSEVITHALHRGNHGETEKKSSEERPPIERVTESVQVRERLGTEEHSGNVTADKGVADRLVDAMGSWFGGKGESTGGFSRNFLRDGSRVVE